jgi:hypothetical protein
MYRITTNTKVRGTHNPFSPNAGTAVTHDATEQEAVVVDIILNDKHPEYSKDGSNIGAVQFRFIKSNTYREQGTLNWALPMDSNITEYPLLNEIVTVVPALNRMYYTRKINVSTRVTSQAMYGLNEELSALPKQGQKVTDYRNSVAVQRKDESALRDVLGKYFKEQPKVYRLRHSEGDILYEGRSGQSIRLGAAWKQGTIFRSTTEDQAPNMLLRVGPDKSQIPSVNTPYGLVTEDINKDLSSVWMVTDQQVPLAYATAGNEIHAASAPAFPKKLEGNQIVINTDRFVINTKTKEIIGSSFAGIHWMTLKDNSIDAGQDYLSKIGRNKIIKIGNYYESTAKVRHSIMSPKIYLGSQKDEAEPVPLGALLAKFLEDYISAHIDNAPKHVITPAGPGILNPKILAALTKLKADVAKGPLASFNSRVAYTVKNAP